MKLLMLPPQTAHTRDWGARLQKDFPRISVVVAESETEASEAIAGADAAFGGGRASDRCRNG